jgi:hypothetical protein
MAKLVQKMKKLMYEYKNNTEKGLRVQARIMKTFVYMSFFISFHFATQNHSYTITPTCLDTVQKSEPKRKKSGKISHRAGGAALLD